MRRRPGLPAALLAAALVLQAAAAAAEPPAPAAAPPAPVAPAPPDPGRAPESRPAAGPAPAPAPGPLAEAGVKLLLGSVVLVGLLYAGSRLVRRLPLGRLLPGTDGPIRLTARTQLGAKESLCLVQVGPTALLLAVTAQSIQTLHVWPEGVGAAPARSEAPAAGGRAPAEPAAERTSVPGQLRNLETWLSVARR